MKLNREFNPLLEETINLSKPLADWFEKNQDWMAYFDLTHMGCLHFERSQVAAYDVRILGRLANACLTYLETSYPFTNEQRALFATQAIAEIYEKEKENMTEVARKLYAIDFEPEKEKQTDFVFVKTMSKHNGIKNRRPGKGHRNH